MPEELAKNHRNIKFLCKIGDEGAEEIINYQELYDLIEEQDLHVQADPKGACGMSRSYGKMVLKPGNPWMTSESMTL